MLTCRRPLSRCWFRTMSNISGDEGGGGGAGGLEGRNRLRSELSPYLRQHKDNPVDWYPWGTEAIQRCKVFVE
jgi:hypothetical protein